MADNPFPLSREVALPRPTAVMATVSLKASMFTR
jgi:hypothetical protein